MTVRSALEQGAKLLDEAKITAARLNAEVLLSHAIRCDRAWLYAHSDEELREVWWIHYGRYLSERLKGKPTQYITKKQEFYGRDFLVNGDVLIPRPETEHVVEAALEKLTAMPGRIVDVGCGSGAIAITLALETGRPTIATDVSLGALDVAAKNRRKLVARVDLAACDLLSAIASSTAALIVSNPPYVPATDESVLQREVREYEPHVALFGGPDGLDIYRRLVEDAARVLVPGGWIVMEVAYNADLPVRTMLAQWFVDVEMRTDLAGFPRVVAGRLAP